MKTDETIERIKENINLIEKEKLGELLNFTEFLALRYPVINKKEDEASSEKMKGLGKKVWQKLGPDFINDLREKW